MKLDRDEKRQYQSGADTSTNERVCLELPSALSLCRSDDKGAQAEAQRSSDDLRAQQEMADWAFAVAFTSTIGLILSAAGIGLIFVTFKAANEANEIARTSAERQLRAYITMDHVELTLVVGQPMSAKIVIVNTGQTPARELSHCTASGASTEGIGAVKVFRAKPVGVVSRVEIGSGKTYTMTFDTKAPMTQDTFDQFKSEALSMEIGGYVTYRDVFQKRHLFLFRTFVAIRNGVPELRASNRHNGGN